MKLTGKVMKYALVGSVMGVVGMPATNIASAQGVTSEQEKIELASRQWRISLAEKLCTLKQIAAADACYLTQGVRTSEVMGSLQRTRTEISTILAGLEQGDEALGLHAPETDPRTREMIVTQIGEWNRMDRALEGLIQGDDVQRNARIVVENDARLMGQSTVLAAQVAAEYANPEKLSPADAMAVSVARRQRMLVQELRKSVCHIAEGGGSSGDASKKFVQAASTFENSLLALRDGMPTLGIAPPPEREITQEIEFALERWNEVKPIFLSLALRGSASPEELEQIGALTASLQLNMDNVVTRYLMATLGEEDFFRIPLKSYAETELASWFADPVIIDAVKSQNQLSASLSQDQIDALDQEWRDQTKRLVKPLIEDLLSRPASDVLVQHQTEAAGFVTEVFVMDNRGLNVAQSEVTSDFWQGDEAKWQEVVGNGSGKIHISEVEFDDSTQAYQAQVSLPIKDPVTDELIGGVTLGVNVQFLL